jgi:hypothetical protein
MASPSTLLLQGGGGCHLSQSSLPTKKLSLSSAVEFLLPFREEAIKSNPQSSKMEPMHPRMAPGQLLTSCGKT